MNHVDYAILILMGIAAVVSAASFSVVVNDLFNRGLADRNRRNPNLIVYYKVYLAHTRRQNGRIGVPFGVHVVSTALFVALGVGYVTLRFIVPLFL